MLSLRCDFVSEKTQQSKNYWHFNQLCFFSRIWAHETCEPKIGTPTFILVSIIPWHVSLRLTCGNYDQHCSSNLLKSTAPLFLGFWFGVSNIQTEFILFNRTFWWILLLIFHSAFTEHHILMMVSTTVTKT